MPDGQSSFLGLRTVVYHVADLEKAKNWYAEVLQFDPYFDTPYYVGFNVGGFELGLHPAESIDNGIGNNVAYWGVPDAAMELARLVSLGASPRSELQEVGNGINVAEVVDPFGNVLGIIENPSFPNTATSSSEN
jgi:predicted enzyme related to lactoylglutathione lyase